MPIKKDAKNKKQNTSSEIEVYNLKGNVVEKITLPHNIFNVEINHKLLSQAVRVYESNQRAGTHSTKTRSMVKGSTRKIYKQKGTGRARHGDVKAPIFRGGGISHGPIPKDYSLKLPKEMRRQALFSALSDKYKEGKLKIVKGVEELSMKTKSMVDLLKNLNVVNGKYKLSKKTAFILDKRRENLIFSGRNINYLTLFQASQINAYDILKNDNLIFVKEAITVVNELYNRNKKSLKEVKADTSLKKDEKTKKKKVMEKPLKVVKPKNKLKLKKAVKNK